MSEKDAQPVQGGAVRPPLPDDWASLRINESQDVDMAQRAGVRLPPDARAFGFNSPRDLRPDSGGYSATMQVSVSRELLTSLPSASS